MHPVKNVKFSFLIMAVVTFCVPLAFVEGAETALLPLLCPSRKSALQPPWEYLLLPGSSAPRAGDLKAEHF